MKQETIWGRVPIRQGEWVELENGYRLPDGKARSRVTGKSIDRGHCNHRLDGIPHSHVHYFPAKMYRAARPISHAATENISACGGVGAAPSSHQGKNGLRKPTQSDTPPLNATTSSTMSTSKKHPATPHPAQYKIFPMRADTQALALW